MARRKPDLHDEVGKYAMDDGALVDAEGAQVGEVAGRDGRHVGLELEYDAAEGNAAGPEVQEALGVRGTDNVRWLVVGDWRDPQLLSLGAAFFPRVTVDCARRLRRSQMIIYFGYYCEYLRRPDLQSDAEIKNSIIILK